MSWWRLWWWAGRGEVPSGELIAAAKGLPGGSMRRVRRKVRRGRLVEGPELARYAVAFARERQRRDAGAPSLRVSAAIGVLFGVAGLGLAADAFARAEVLKGVASGAFAGFFFYMTWRGWRGRRSVVEAERVNRDYLQRLGAAYVPGGAATAVSVHRLAVICSMAVRLLVFIPCAGVLVLWLEEEPVSLGGALSAGVPCGVGFAVAVLMNSSRSRAASAGRSEAAH